MAILLSTNMAANLARVLASADNEPVTEAYAYAAQASLPKALYSLVIAELGYCERNVGRKLSDSASVLSSKLALFDGRSALANGYCMVLLLLVTTHTSEQALQRKPYHGDAFEGPTRVDDRNARSHMRMQHATSCTRVPSASSPLSVHRPAYVRTRHKTVHNTRCPKL